MFSPQRGLSGGVKKWLFPTLTRKVVLWYFFTSETYEKNPQFKFSCQNLSAYNVIFSNKTEILIEFGKNNLFCFVLHFVLCYNSNIRPAPMIESLKWAGAGPLPLSKLKTAKHGGKLLAPIQTP